MKKLPLQIWILFGRTVYYLSYPLLALYLRLQARTRVLIECEGEYLLVKSWLGSGKWELPGGGLHAQENPVDGALRELKEELSIIADPSRISLINTGRYQNGLVGYKAHYLHLKLDTKPSLKIQKIEITEARWLTKKQLKLYGLNWVFDML